MECITTWGKAGTPKTSKEEKTQLGCPAFVTTEMYPNIANTKQQILPAIHQDLWLSVGLHKRTRCCHPQWKCYRQLKPICAANHRDQCHRHQLLDYLHPNVPTSAAVWRLQCIWQYAAYFSKNNLTIGHALLKTQNWIWTQACTLHIYHISAYQYFISVCCTRLYRNHINLSNKNYSDMEKSLDSDTGLEYRAWSWPRRCGYWNLMQIELKCQHVWTWHIFL